MEFGTLGNAAFYLQVIPHLQYNDLLSVECLPFNTQECGSTQWLDDEDDVSHYHHHCIREGSHQKLFAVPAVRRLLQAVLLDDIGEHSTGRLQCCCIAQC